MWTGPLRGLGPGPVFIYEWITSSRRWQAYALRSMFVIGLLAALLVVGLGREGRLIAASAPPLRAMAQIGETLFVAVVGTQLTLVLLAAPAATAGAICLDRSRGTLAHLLATDLTDTEIVLGKLAARLAPVLTLVAAAFPFMELLTLLGGVSPDALLGAFLVALGVAVLGCCLAMLFSVWVRRTHEAMLATYAVWGLWLLGTPMINMINRVTSIYFPSLPPTADPYRLAFAPYWHPGSVGPEDYLAFLAATWGLSAVLALIAWWTMRRACTRDADRGATRRRRLPAGLEAMTGNVRRVLDRAGPSLDFNPVLWREWHRNRPARWARFVALLFLVGALTFSMIAISRYGGRGTAPWVNALQLAIGLLMLSVIAATSLAEERASGSLDVLMTTPMETWKIVIGKWLGTFRLVPPLAVLPVLVILGASGPREHRWPYAFAMVLFVLASGAAITSLGLAMATWCPRPGRAVGLTVTLYLLVAVAWLFLAGLQRGPSSDRLLMCSPFFWSGQVTDSAVRGSDREWNAAIGWIVAYGTSGLVLLLAALSTFNRCLGRVR